MSYIEHLLQLSPLVAYSIIGLIVFAETGLLLGFFFPGDSLLVTAGLLASQGHFSLVLICIICSITSILGNILGYTLGRTFGPAIFNQKDSWLFNKKNVQKAHAFYEKYGVLTIILSRFTPVIRTFAPTLAGVAKMSRRVFTLYTIIGGIAWSISIPVLGYFLGKTFPNIDKYILPIIGVVIVVSAIPAIREIMKNRHDSLEVSDDNE